MWSVKMERMQSAAREIELEAEKNIVARPEVAEVQARAISVMALKKQVRKTITANPQMQASRLLQW